MYKVVISVCLPVLLCPIITLDPMTDLHQNLIKEVEVGLTFKEKVLFPN